MFRRIQSVLTARPLLPAGAMGLIALVAAVWMSWPLRRVSFDPPEPFRDAVIAIQWNASSQTLEALLGTEPHRTERMRVLWTSTRRDNAFAAAYVLFMVLFAVAIAYRRHRGYFLFLGGVSLFIGLLDWAENSAIQTLLLLYDSETFGPGGADFVRVRLFSSVKWAGIALYFAGVAPYFWQKKRCLERVLALLAAGTAVLGGLAQFFKVWAEPYVLCVFLLLAIATGYCFRATEASVIPPEGPS